MKGTNPAKMVVRSATIWGPLAALGFFALLLKLAQ